MGAERGLAKWKSSDFRMNCWGLEVFVRRRGPCQVVLSKVHVFQAEVAAAWDESGRHREAVEKLNDEVAHLDGVVEEALKYRDKCRHLEDEKQMLLSEMASMDAEKSSLNKAAKVGFELFTCLHRHRPALHA